MAAFAWGGGNISSGSNPVPHSGWQWRDDNGMWVDFEPMASSIVDRDFLGAMPSSIVHSAVGGRHGTGATYDINFSQMEQVNSRTSFIRPIRRDAALNAPCPETWSWKKGSRWEALPLRVCLQLIAARDYRREQSTPAHMGAEIYDFDLSQMAAINRLSGSRRQMRAEAAAGATTGAGSGRDAEFRRILTAAKDSTNDIASDETCAVCMDPFTAQQPALLLPGCRGHYLHGPCAMEVFAAMGPRCPTCSRFFAAIHGTQPDGTMTTHTFPVGQRPLAGFSSCGTIVITYNFPNGIQGPRHPAPGQRYSGTARTAYLPDNRDGREVLELLKKAFDQRVTFTVGTSITTGRSNCVVWNGVHHKTNMSGGSAMFGYPDPTYFSRVKAELLAKGIS